MRESEPLGMQELALQTELARPSVESVAGDGETDRSEVHTDLVGPAGLQPHVEERVPLQHLLHREMCDRFPWLVGVEGLSQRVAAVAPDRRLDAAASRSRSSDDQGGVVPFEYAAAHEILKTGIRLFRPRDDHEPGGVAVETVHDAGTGRISPCDVVFEQTLHERPRRVSGCRVHHETGRLVDHHEVVVLVGDTQVHRLGRELGDLAYRRLELELLAAGETLALAEWRAVDEDCSRFEQSFGHAAGADLRQGREEAVEPLARSVVRDALLHARAGAGPRFGPKPRAPAAELPPRRR